MLRIAYTQKQIDGLRMHPLRNGFRRRDEARNDQSHLIGKSCAFEL